MVRQYIGARYIPKWCGVWDNTTVYEALSIVSYNNATYTSKKPVPTGQGNPATATEYWALSGNLSGKIDDILTRLSNAENSINGLDTDVDNIKETIKGYTFVTPEMYGAIGDGVTDDTDAFDDIPEGSVIFMNNKYKVTTLNCKDNQLYINGVLNAGTVVIDEVNASFIDTTFNLSNKIDIKATNHFDSNILLDGCRIHGGSYGVHEHGSIFGIYLSNCFIEDQAINGIYIETSDCYVDSCTVARSHGDGIVVAGYNTISNTKVYGCGVADPVPSVYQESAGFHVIWNNTNIIGCYAQENTGDGFLIEGDGCKLTGCYSEGNNTRCVYNASNCKVKGNNNYIEFTSSPIATRGAVTSHIELTDTSVLNVINIKTVNSFNLQNKYINDFSYPELKEVVNYNPTNTITIDGLEYEEDGFIEIPTTYDTVSASNVTVVSQDGNTIDFIVGGTGNGSFNFRQNIPSDVEGKTVKGVYARVKAIGNNQPTHNINVYALASNDSTNLIGVNTDSNRKLSNGVGLLGNAVTGSLAMTGTTRKCGIYVDARKHGTNTNSTEIKIEVKVFLKYE